MLESVDREHPSGDSGLVRNDNQPITGVAESPEAPDRPRDQTNKVGIDVVWDVLNECSVLVQKDGPFTHTHGHDVSRIGMTITSGITVSSGWFNTNRIVFATF